jgi:hypothetical protein
MAPGAAHRHHRWFHSPLGGHAMRTASRLSISIGAGLLLLVAASGAAQTAPPTPPIKPGLWLIHMTQEGEGMANMAEMDAQMKKMPPEARKQVEAMMKQHGVDIASPGDLKICLNKDSLAQGWQGGAPNARCKTDYAVRSGNTWQFHQSCPDPHPSETDGEASFTSAEQYAVKTTTTTAMGGQMKTMKMTAVSKWLGADCGDIKPVQPARQK